MLTRLTNSTCPKAETLLLLLVLQSGTQICLNGHQAGNLSKYQTNLCAMKGDASASSAVARLLQSGCSMSCTHARYELYQTSHVQYIGFFVIVC